MDHKGVTKAAMGHKIVGPHGRDNSDMSPGSAMKTLPVNNAMNETKKSTSGYGTGAGRSGGGGGKGKMSGGY